jgi:hypothetical protein
MTDSVRNISSSTELTDAELRWSVHLATESRVKLICAVAAVLLACVGAFAVVGPVGPIAVALALTGALAEFLFPVTFEIGPKSAVCKTLFKRSEIAWDHVKTCYVNDWGVKLSPLEPGNRLEPFRGVFLRFGGNRDQVIEAVKSMRGVQC